MGLTEHMLCGWLAIAALLTGATGTIVGLIGLAGLIKDGRRQQGCRGGGGRRRPDAQG